MDSLLYLSALKDGYDYIKGADGGRNILPDVITLAKIAANPIKEGHYNILQKLKILL